jgi:hypothetical protein
MTWTIKVRGAPGPMVAEFDCPEHGRFAATVHRDLYGDPPFTSPCQAMVDGAECGRFAPFVVSAPRLHFPAFISARRGQGDEKPHPMVTSTEDLADGKVTLQEWRKKRQAMWAAHDADSDPDRPRKVYSK